ncbi:type VI secretion system baseplate subunit TssF [Paraburkholderia sp. J63]|uniref:type VI secretion system baseplate subunit TssF n=1 Tax=Paraburkholderia sp. J63 TaxID=2805434 RepID=UPI002ABDEAAE|nr:type VI secretion system baseplate subunit TssF [Paraburkholderia sp. J63]
MNDDSTLRYYEAEMRYLTEAGREFANTHPDRARMLNLDRVGERDPYVERLFEGFAFLVGRLREKLDDELPEITEALVSLLWPHYLRTLPSLSILELEPDFGTLQKRETIPAGIEVRSDPIGQEGTRCTYRTTWPVDLLPLHLKSASAGTRADGRSTIRLTFQIEAQSRQNTLNVPHLRLYLNADRPVAMALHLALTRHVDDILLRIPAVRDGEPKSLPDACFATTGFAADERLWPKPDNAFGGYQLLLEYFSFPEKFLFVDLHGIDLASLAPRVTEFEIEVVLNQAYPADLRFSEKNIRLFCTPIINLFRMDAEPIRVDHQATSYVVRPRLRHGEHVETYSVDAVDAHDHASGDRVEYVPFSSFKHRGGMLRHDAPERYYHTRVQQGVKGLYETWLVLGGHAWENAEELPRETLSLRVTGTNGMLPRKGLREASINEMGKGISNVARVRNLVSPTLPLHPPTGDRFQWRILSHLTPNYLSLLDAEVLRGTLGLYDWTDGEMNRRRLNGIQKVTRKGLRKVMQGAVERGVQIEVTLDSHAFAGEGDMMLFGEMLHRFFELYADVNLFTQLVIVSLPTQERVEWPASKSDRAPL